MGTSTGQRIFGGANVYGTVFKITPSGALTTLYSFCSQTNCTDGQYPSVALVQAISGDFYGTTDNGGANGYYGGTIFKIARSGTLTTLYSFCSQTNCTDGSDPSAALVQATNGNFYGTTGYGGASSSCVSFFCGYGTFFKITSSKSSRRASRSGLLSFARRRGRVNQLPVSNTATRKHTLSGGR
ncbi:MAG: choice-of-anchor tandem repeat GloVer-containing protein [Bryobacteraceae bacterium]|jgi:uncharacterized repeat protein (TIGR03803 family)